MPRPRQFYDAITSDCTVEVESFLVEEKTAEKALVDDLDLSLRSFYS